MILNAFAVLDAFVALLRLVLALGILGLLASGRLRTRLSSFAESERTENRNYLVFVLSLLLLSFHAIAWPLQYAVLQSYVPQWPGVMCIYGVLRVGTGSEGAAGWLPHLLAVLQWTKPLAVFLGGGWIVLYLVNRQTVQGSHTARLLSILSAFVALTACDALVEGAYLAIPKRENVLEAGCCSVAIGSQPSGTDGTDPWNANEVPQSWLMAAFFLWNGGIALSVAYQYLTARGQSWSFQLPQLLAAAAISPLISGIFLTHAASPRILGLPFHHCPYELLVRAPESILGIGAFGLGLFALGWAVLLGDGRQTSIAQARDRLRFLSFFGYSTSMTLFATELVLS